MKPTRLDCTDETLFNAHLFWNGNTQKRDDQAHHLGHGRWTPRAWRKHGQGYLDLFKEYYGEDASHGRMLEWGCGGGANVVAFAGQFEHITGVDIAPDSLRRCVQACEEIVPTWNHFFPFPIAIDDPFAARVLTNEGLFDFLLCIEVIQHMPSARYAHDVMALWSELCWKGAGAMVQFRTHFRSRPIHRSPKLAYHQNVSRWLMLNPRIFVDMAIDAGWEVVAMRGTGLTEFDPQRPTGYVDAFLRKA